MRSTNWENPTRSSPRSTTGSGSAPRALESSNGRSSFFCPFGGFLLPIIGWVLGVILLWASRVWSTREKLIGTLLVPGGLSAVLFLAVFGSGATCTGSGGAGRPTIEHCTGTAIPNAIGIPLLIAFVAAGIVTPIFLARRALASRL
jgi:hypothetical protein